MAVREQIYVHIYSPIDAIAGRALFRLAFAAGKRMEDSQEIRHALYWLGIVLDAEDL